MCHRSSGFVRTWVQNLSKPRHSTEGWFEREKTCTMSWIVDWTTSVGTECSKSGVRLSCGCATCRTSTSRVLVIDGVSCDAFVVALETEGAHAHLVHVSLSNNNCTSLFKFFYCSWIKWRLKALQNEWSCAGLHSLDQNIVLDSDWNTINERKLFVCIQIL